MNRLTIQKPQTKSKMYAVPAHLVEKAEAEAVRRRTATGKLIRWSDVVREILEQRLK